MKKFVVGILSFFDNELKLYNVEAETDSEALKQVYIDQSLPDYKEDAIKWMQSLDNDIESIKDAMFNSDVAINVVEVL